MSCSILLLAICVPMVVGIVALLMPKTSKDCREYLALLTTGFLFVIALWIFLKGASPFQAVLLTLGEFVLAFDLAVTPLASFMFLFASGFAVLIALYSMPFMADTQRLRTYYAFLLFALGGSAGVFFSNNLLVFLIFWEVLMKQLLKTFLL